MAEKIIWTPDKDRLFINPYNFVSTTRRVARKPLKNGGSLTGYIECTLRVRNKLAIPDVEQNPDSNSFDFFSVNGKPVITGSELRGCIRSSFEAVTESCFSVVNSDLLSKRMPKPSKYRLAGILKKTGGKWVIYKADYISEKWHKKMKGSKPYDLERRWFKLSNTPQIATTYFSFNRDRSGGLESAKARCSDNDIQKLEAVYSTYFDGIRNSDARDVPELRKKISGYIEDLRRMRKTDDSDIMVPVFYETDTSVGTDGLHTLTYLSPAQTGRVSFRNTVPSLLGDHQPCSGKNGFCPACTLFGTIGKNFALASSLRFTDAYEKSEGSVSISGKKVIMPEMSSPKISTVEFYSLPNHNGRENVRFWNYDSKGVRLRGRKFYFHGVPKEADDLNPRQMETKVAQEGSTFSFKVYFDKIEKLQLQQLLWVLTIGDNDPCSNQMHKLGAGKPFGYGSVKITADSVCIRKIDKSSLAYSLERKSYDDIMSGFVPKFAFDTKALTDFITITDYSLTVDSQSGAERECTLISYPIAERVNDKSKNANAGHQWFKANRRPDGTFGKILPTLSHDVNALSLEALIEKKAEGSGKKNSYGKPSSDRKPKGRNQWNNKDKRRN